ncbi:MAG: SGNH/GDSL hydrolase family protein [Legionellaceae bacterium]|nr:SGNH/GDSL hydrolase family protein [Legionellaceae bacterium]
MRILSSLLSLVLSASLFAGPSFNRIVVFGDSLSDTGNLYEYMDHKIPQSPPYYEGHFSNGPLWIEGLAEAWAPENPQDFILNYAFGGAGVSESDDDADMFTLKKEISTFLSAHDNVADPDSLYVVWIGANNYFAIPDDVDGAVEEVTGGIRRGLQRLLDAGSQHILVMNIPDLGTVPVASEFGEIERMREYSTKHNQRLQSIFDELKRDNPERNWYFYDVEAMLHKVMQNPEPYGITNTVDTCYDAVIEKGSEQLIMRFAQNIQPYYKQNYNRTACDGYLFFDPVHPTKIAHSRLALEVLKLFSDDKQPDDQSDLA